MKYLFFLLIVSIPFHSFCQDAIIDSVDGVPVEIDLNLNKNVSSDFIKKYYLHPQLDQYLNNFQEDIIYLIETTGDFADIDPYVFSFNGNSYQWNKYYYNGARINDTYFPGTSLFKPSLNHIDLVIDHLHSSLLFSDDKDYNPNVSLQFNAGALGGPAPYYADLVHLYHRTATEALYRPVPDQRHITGAAKFVCQTNFKYKNKVLPQTFSLLNGQRILPDYEYNGIRAFYPENYLHFQANGELPLISKLFDKNEYLFSAINRGNLFVEQNFNRNETAKLNQVNLSLIGDKRKSDVYYSTGLNFSFKHIKHNDLYFYRNVADQDGIGFEPWYPDANVIELSHSFTYKKEFLKQTFFNVNTFNACVFNSPTATDFYNPVYFESLNISFTPLQVMKWQANSFAAGILENSMGVNTIQSLIKQVLVVKASGDLTFDAALIKQKSLLKPNTQYEGSLIFKPAKFIELTVNTGKVRVPFNYDLVRFLSNDYLNGQIYYWKDVNNDKGYSPNEIGSLLTSTGGKYHDINTGIKQPAYYYLEIPFKVNLTKHQSITFSSYYKKFVNTWNVDYSSALDDNTTSIYNNFGFWYFLKPQQHSYSIVQYNTNNMIMLDKTDRFKNAPYSQGYTLKYQLHNPKFFLSASWTTYMVFGYSAEGNGYVANNVGVLSESMASPNTRYFNTGRYDSDRAYIGRMLMSYKVTKHLSMAFQFLYKDGEPITFFNTQLYVDSNGTQVAIRNDFPKGGNRLLSQFGPRKDGFFNTELRFLYEAQVFKQKINVNLSIYNIYDFRTELSEYAFPAESGMRKTLELNIPRGILISFQYFL